MSYNNSIPMRTPRRAAFDHSEIFSRGIIKHVNPWHRRLVGPAADAHRKAPRMRSAQRSALGGVIACNTEVTVAPRPNGFRRFTEVIVAPAYQHGAVDIGLQEEHPACSWRPSLPSAVWRFCQITGGLLMVNATESDAAGDDPAGWTLAAGSRRRVDAGGSEVRLARVPGGQVQRDRRSGRRCDGRVGMGQVNRVDAAMAGG